MRASAAAIAGGLLLSAATLPSGAAHPTRPIRRGGAATPLPGSAPVAWFTVTGAKRCCPDPLPQRRALRRGQDDARPDSKRALNTDSLGRQNFTGADPVCGELQWRTRGATAGGDAETATATGTVSFPVSDVGLFPPDGG